MDINQLKDILSSGLLEQYVLGLTSDIESAKVEEWAEIYPKVASELKLLSHSLEQEAKQNAVSAPVHLKQKIFNEIGGEQVDIKSKSAQQFRSILLAAAGLLIGVLLAGFWYNQKIQSVKQEMQVLQSDLESLQDICEKNQREKILLAHIQNEDTKALLLTGSSLYPEARVMVYWNEELEAGYLKLIDMPDSPEGTCYQLWADVEGEMIDMGVLKESQDFVEVPFISNAESLNITREPKGGSKHPTVEKIYASGKV